VAAFVPRGTYSAAKAWVVSFSESVAAELNGTGVRCMALCPGFTHTEFHDRAEVDPGQIPGWMWLDAPDVVDAAIEDLRRGLTVSVPSIKYKALVGASKIVPRRLGTRLGRGVSKRW
jgi:short-subunit dehydrogenase